MQVGVEINHRMVLPWTSVSKSNIFNRARAPARSQPCYETLQICEEDENHMNAAADAQHTVSGSAGLF